MAPPPPPALMEELVEEILLRLPPDEPAHLVRAALVCKPWRRILSDRGFLRRYREFHRAPPLLGYIHNLYYGAGPIPRFVPTSTASPFSPPALSNWWALDCRHGRVLIHNYAPMELIVWDPITGEQQHLSLPAYPHAYCTGAVLCAADSCDHLDCHGGPFRVVFVGTDVVDEEYVTWASVYSSETGAWSASTYIDVDYYIEGKPSLLIRDALYFTLEYGKSILKYDLCGYTLSVIDTPCVFGAIVMAAEDGGLGFVAVLDDSIYMWSWRAGTEGSSRWVQQWVMELVPLLPRRHPSCAREVIGLVEGTNIIFINSNVGMFTLDLKSRQVRKVGKGEAYSAILPYMSFYIPDFAKGRLSPP